MKMTCEMYDLPWLDFIQQRRHNRIENKAVAPAIQYAILNYMSFYLNYRFLKFLLLLLTKIIRLRKHA